MNGKLLTVVLSLAFLVLIGLYTRHTLVSHAADCRALEAATKERLAGSTTCTADTECTRIKFSCPFDCNTPVRRDLVDESLSAVSAYNKSCMMVCPDCPKEVQGVPRCAEGRCIIDFSAAAG